VIELDAFWRFVAFRPGLSGTAAEWQTCLGPNLWPLWKKQLFANDGVARIVTHGPDHRSCRVVQMTGGTYGLVCETTGDVIGKGLKLAQFKKYRLDTKALRRMLADAFGWTADSQIIPKTTHAISVGTWTPVSGVDVLVFTAFSPTPDHLIDEIQCLLIERGRRFLLLVPEKPSLPAPIQAEIDRTQSLVLSLSELVQCGTDGVIQPSSVWNTAANQYLKRHFSERMALAAPPYQFAKKSMWAIRFAGTETFLDGTLKGPTFIRYLLERQGQEIHVARMLADIAGEERLDKARDAGDLIDEQTFNDCRQRYDELQEERADAERNHPDQLPDIDSEITQLANYFAQCVGLGSKSRKGADDVAKIRKRIARVIEIACDKINENDPQLAGHLKKSIKTHTFMIYEPETEIDWNFE